MVLPDRCSVGGADGRCTDAPTHVISIAAADGEYMIGVACEAHRAALARRIRALQESGKLRAGSVRIEALRAVGTDCIRGDPDDLITP